MKRLVLLWTAVVALTAFSSPSLAEEKFRVGIVDMRKVLVESQAGKRAKDELGKLFKQKQEQVAREEQQLKGMQEAFEKDQLLMTDEQKKKKQEEFQQKLAAFQKMSQDAQRELGQKDQEFTRQAVTEIRPIVQEIAKAEKVKIVYERSEGSVLYVEESVDLTDKVIKAYDAKAGKK